MARLTKRGLGLLNDYEAVDPKGKKMIVQKLGEIEHQGEDLSGKICNSVCRFMHERLDEDDMSQICWNCPLKELMDLIR